MKQGGWSFVLETERVVICTRNREGGHLYFKQRGWSFVLETGRVVICT